jgi:integrase
MANKKVSLYRKCKTPDGWKRYPVAMAANGKVKPDTVLVQGFETKYPVGHYELRTYEGSKTVWTRVTGNGTEALAAMKTAQKRATAVVSAVDAGVQVIADPKRVTLVDAQKKFVAAALARGALEAAEVHGRSLDEFKLVCSKRYADELTRDDVTAYHSSMRKQGLLDRTIYNRHMSLRSFVLFLGLDADELCGPTPRFEQAVVEIFEREELTPFFATLTEEYDKLLFDVLLTTGLREQEAMHLEWRSINRSARTLRVRSNEKYGFKVKDAEQREVPLSEDLLARLLAYREHHPKALLVFGRRGGKMDKPDGHLLRRLKQIIRRAGLNCGSCSTCSATDECEHWYLHKFRATYITTLLRNGLDLRTVMKLSGHADLESVIRYLRPAEGKQVQDKVNAIEWR